MPRPSASRRRTTPLNSLVGLRTRPPLERFQQILDVLKHNRCPSRQDLASELEVTTKTIQRDIDFLRDRMNAPIEFNRDRGGYILTGPVEDLPRVDLSTSELVSIYVAQKALRAYRGTAFEAPLRSAFEKLSSSLDGRVSVSLTEMEASLSFRQFEARPVELKVFQTVATAVQKQKLLEIDYLKLDAKKPQKRKIEPYHLACVQGQWYCIAHDLRPDDLRTFHLGRIKSARLLADDFNRPKTFNIDKYLAGSLGIFAGKGAFEIILHFDKWSAQLVRERTWHPTQKLQELTHGELELTLQLNNLEEVEPWVLSWGAHVRVVGPKELKARIRATAETVLKKI
jgi:predicted DNA-binding transcriptional regulator YafY